MRCWAISARTAKEAAIPLAFFAFPNTKGFVQDNWKVNRRLSLELGMRWQYGTPIYTQASNTINVDPALYKMSQAVTVLPNGTIVPGSGNRYNGLIREGNGIPASELGRVPNATSPDIALVPPALPAVFMTRSFALLPASAMPICWIQKP